MAVATGFLFAHLFVIAHNAPWVFVGGPHPLFEVSIRRSQYSPNTHKQPRYNIKSALTFPDFSLTAPHTDLTFLLASSSSSPS